MNNKKLNIFIIISIFIINISVYGENMKLVYDGVEHDYNAAPIFLKINGEMVETKVMPPILLNDSTLVPAREVFEKLGAVVYWDAQNKEVKVGMDKWVIILKIDKNIALVNGQEYTMLIPPKIINNKTMIPLRFVAETIGYNVKWIGQERLIVIDEPEELHTEEVEKVEDTEEVEDTEDNIVLPYNSIPVSWGTSKESVEEIIFNVEPREYETTEIIDIEAKKGKDGVDRFIIYSKEEISNLSYSKWEEKFILDIDNSIMNLEKTKIELDDNPICKSIRVGQFEEDVTRVVFDFVGNMNCDISLSQDRKSIVVQTKMNSINKIDFYIEDEYDYLEIEGDFLPATNIFRLTDNDRIVIDLPNSVSNIGYKEYKGNYIYTQGIRTNSLDETTTRVVLDTKGQPEYEIINKENVVCLRIKKPSYKGITYNNSSDIKIVLDSVVNIYSTEDDYMNNKYTIVLDRYYEEFGSGILDINDGVLENIEVINKDDKTSIIINEKNVYTYDIVNTDTNTLLYILKPKQKYNNIVFIDPGHGASDPGAVANGLKEKDINLDMALILYDYLQRDNNIKAYISRTEDVYPSNYKRTEVANDIEADIFISIHNNAALSQKANGSEFLYYPSEDDEGFNSKRLAEIMRDNLYNYIDTKDRGLIERPNLIVLKYTKMPATLLEIAYMTNVEDANRLKSDDFLQNTGLGMYEGIREVFGLK